MLQFAPSIKNIRNKITKTEAKLQQLRKEKSKLLGETIFRCDAVLQKGTLFEQVCGAETPINELTYIQPMYYNNAPYEEGWESAERRGKLECPFCKTIWSFSTDYNYTTKKYEEENEYIALKNHFKDVVEQKSY